jgi:hypothetical protein
MQKLQETIQRQHIAFQPEAADYSFAHRGKKRGVAEFFSREYIADMDLDDGGFDGGYGITDGDRCMRISSGIEYDTVIGEAHLLQFVYELTLYVSCISSE